MDMDELKAKYEQRIRTQFKDKIDEEDLGNQSSEYLDFVKENQIKAFSLYEQACNWCAKSLPISPDPAAKKEMERDLASAHIQTTPEGVMSFSFMFPLACLFISSAVLYLVSGDVMLVFMSVIISMCLMMPLQKLPSFYAQIQRMQAANQMVLAVFYIVTYMRHTSNLERAIGFASEHISPPLAFDLKRIVWNVETKKFNTIYDSLEEYLQEWNDFAPEFVESMHVVVGSLYETDENKRQELLDKSLDLILQETFDKMLHYAHNLQSPITALHMLGIVLPILGLIILPLMVNFLPEVKWYYIMIMYNIILPAAIFYMSRKILSKRPSGGGGGVQIDMNNPYVRKLVDPPVLVGNQDVGLRPIHLLYFSLGFFLFLGFLPLLLHFVGMGDIGFTFDSSVDFRELSPCEEQFCLLGYVEGQEGGPYDGQQIGPFGLGSTLLSLFVPLAFCLGFGFYLTLKTKQLIQLRNDTRKLEDEFVGALFQLGNRLGDGLPPEMAFQKVAMTMPNSKSGDFFQLISVNISKLGMSVNQAIFDPKNGALIYYPSSLIESSMKILTQSAQKGPAVASNAISNVARYIKEMNRVNERLQDLMAEVISSMKSQISFLTPIISGIVIGITSMITTILQQLGTIIGGMSSADGDISGTGDGSLGGVLSMFGDGIPTYYFQIIVGVYVVQVVYLLSSLINSIQNGVDPINEQFEIGSNIFKSVGLYVGISFIIILLFNVIASSVLNSLA
jgi:hypothetical protein